VNGDRAKRLGRRSGHGIIAADTERAGGTGEPNREQIFPRQGGGYAAESRARPINDEGRNMTVLLQVDFPFEGPWGAEMSEGMKGLAESIAREPGLLWKIWTENAEAREAGGIYLFADRASAEAYLKMHRARLTGFGVPQVNAKLFEVNAELSAIDRGPLG
jgi:hypothetical protein